MTNFIDFSLNQITYYRDYVPIIYSLYLYGYTIINYILCCNTDNKTIKAYRYVPNNIIFVLEHSFLYNEVQSDMPTFYIPNDRQSKRVL